MASSKEQLERIDRETDWKDPTAVANALDDVAEIAQEAKDDGDLDEIKPLIESLLAKAQPQEEKPPSFWQKHKGSILSGLGKGLEILNMAGFEANVDPYTRAQETKHGPAGKISGWLHGPKKNQAHEMVAKAIGDHLRYYQKIANARDPKTGDLTKDASYFRTHSLQDITTSLETLQRRLDNYIEEHDWFPSKEYLDSLLAVYDEKLTKYQHMKKEKKDATPNP